MALAAMVHLGGLPIGGPIIGWIADLAGPRTAVALGSMAALLAGAVALRHLPARNTGPTGASELALRGAQPSDGTRS